MMISYSLTNKLISLLIAFEGFSSCAYWDVSQYSNGYGTKAAHRLECISEQTAKARLLEHSSKDIEFILSKYKIKNRKPVEGEILALASYCYNTGRNGCDKAVKLAANGERHAASWAMRQKINKGTKNEAGLKLRREKETALLLEPASRPSFNEWIIGSYDN